MASIATCVTCLLGEPLCGVLEHPVKCFERTLDRLSVIGTASCQPDRYRNRVLADIDRRAPLVKDLHHYRLPTFGLPDARRQRSPNMN